MIRTMFLVAALMLSESIAIAQSYPPPRGPGYVYGWKIVIKKTMLVCAKECEARVERSAVFLADTSDAVLLSTGRWTCHVTSREPLIDEVMGFAPGSLRRVTCSFGESKGRAQVNVLCGDRFPPKVSDSLSDGIAFRRGVIELVEPGDTGPLWDVELTCDPASSP